MDVVQGVSFEINMVGWIVGHNQLDVPRHMMDKLRKIEKDLLNPNVVLANYGGKIENESFLDLLIDT